MKDDNFLKLETSHVINYDKNFKELNENQFSTAEEKLIFNIFSGGDGILDKKDYDNIWKAAKKFAQRNGNPELLDDKEISMLKEYIINSNDDNKISIQSFSSFLRKVLQKQDRIMLEDTAQLSIGFHEIKEEYLSSFNDDVDQNTINKKAEDIFNPDNKEVKIEYYDDKQIKSKTLADGSGTITYNEDGSVNKVEKRTESGWDIIQFWANSTRYHLTKTTSDKNILRSEAIYNGGKITSATEYDIENQNNRTEYYYFDDNNIHSSVKTEYVEGKKQKNIFLIRIINYQNC